MDMTNILFKTDSYKFSHYRQYPKGTQRVYSYFESRGGMFPETVFFGLQYYLKRYLTGRVLFSQDISGAKAFASKHFGTEYNFNEDGWKSVLEKHDGTLPLIIKAVPEGAVVPTGNVLMTAENTDDDFPWLVNYFESLLSKIWYPTTIATNSREIKKIIKSYLEETGDVSGLNFKLHDFGYRGVSSEDSAALGSAAHLINFLGTDTIMGIAMADTYYHSGVCGFSIPASEHSTITSWGKDHEVDAFRNMLDQYPTGIVACVSDSYDIFQACEKYWGGELRDKVLGRNGVLVVRPDSGDPVSITEQVFEILWNTFGGTTNSKGYRVLDPHVRMIQGDGINWHKQFTYDANRSFEENRLHFESLPPVHTVDEIYGNFKDHKISADNLGFGSGGGLLQDFDRDTQKFAFKCSNIVIDGIDRDVWKSPVTQKGKMSKRGRLALVKTENGYKTIKLESALNNNVQNELITVFRNGTLLVDHSFEEIRKRAEL